MFLFPCLLRRTVPLRRSEGSDGIGSATVRRGCVNERRYLCMGDEGNIEVILKSEEKG
jgi:hypothetical protein